MPAAAITAVSPPPHCTLPAASADYVDAYQVTLPDHQRLSAAEAAWLLLGQGPGWISGLLRLRDWLVRPLGLTTSPAQAQRPIGQLPAPGQRMGPFQVFSITPQEVILGQDDRHLNFRVSVAVDEACRTAVVTTAVWHRNWLGRLYFALVRPFHQLIVPALLRHALRPAAGR